MPVLLPQPFVQLREARIAPQVLEDRSSKKGSTPANTTLVSHRSRRSHRFRAGQLAALLGQDAARAGEDPTPRPRSLAAWDRSPTAQCTVNAAGSSASGAPSGSGNTLTLVLNMSFTPAFDGNRVIYTAVRDMAEANNLGWQSMGTWTVE